MRYDPAPFEKRQPVNSDKAALIAVQADITTPDVSSEDRRSTFAAPDVPPAVGGLIAAVYTVLLAALFVATAGSLSSIFAIAMAAVFLAVFFTVPAIFFVVEGDSSRRPSLDTFMQRGLQTYTGHSSGSAALVQMLVVPVFLTFGVVGIGIIIAFTA